MDAEQRIIRRGRQGQLQVVGGTRRRWSARIEAEFLAVLAAGGNVRRACQAIQWDSSTVYERRANYPSFAAKWATAKENARDNLETLLVENATNVLEGAPHPPDSPIPRMTVGEALALLAKLREPGKQGGANAGRPLEPADGDAARESILRKVAALRRAKGLE